MIFLGSMGDFFDKDIPPSFREDCLAYIRAAKNHLFVILTKQVPLNLNYPRNLWLGVSIDGVSYYWERPLAALRELRERNLISKAILSFEPLLSSHLPVTDDIAYIDWAIIGADSRRPETMAGKEWIANYVAEMAKRAGYIPLFVKDNLSKQKCIRSQRYSWASSREFTGRF